MVWYGMVWYGMVWYGMVWRGEANFVKNPFNPCREKRKDFKQWKLVLIL